jgi:hypothetical protein
MSPEDRAEAAKRLLDDPLAMELVATIEQDAIEEMIAQGVDDDTRRKRADLVLVARSFKRMLEMIVRSADEAKRNRVGVA